MNKHQKKSEIRVSKKSQRLNQGVVPVVKPAVKLNSNLQNWKQNFKQQKKNNVFIEDIYEKAQNAREMVRGSTGLVYDKRMVNHRCLWDPLHQECPDRFMKTLDRCEELGLVERCQQVHAREATEMELLTVHSQNHIDHLKMTHNCLDMDQMEKFASKFDAVYIHPETYQLALLSAGSTIQLVHEVCTGAVQNGMAIVRPPGHHAMHSEFCGYCYFNNVAVAARHALDQLGLQRILIVDWDVHHGQATQRMFYDDPRVVYFSIHRYEHGEFWPNLRESEFDYIGEDAGAGYNFNVPLNETGLGDPDYMAIFHQVLLPMVSEFQPELVIVSAGYDAAFGCPEGEMTVTPACYAHLVSSLMGLASGKVAVILEGGYCVRSLSEGAALTLRALLHDPCPNLPVLPPPSKSVQESILNCIYSHRAYWQCFQLQGTYAVKHRDPDSETQHWPQVLYNYSAPKIDSYPTRITCPVQTQEVKEGINRTLDMLIAETKLLKTKHEVCFIYDPLMMEHKNLNDPGHPENPSRISSIYEKHADYNLLDRLFLLKSRVATREELLLVHEEAYLQELEKLCASTKQMTDDVKYQLSVLEKKKSVYINPQSYNNASLAAGSLLQVVDSVMKGESKAGVAVIRPPGHHAESFEACGFCLFNNVSIAAKYAVNKYGAKRILLLDWDVHHGNGTQRIFLSDPQVLYLSIHRYDRGTFFPCSEDAAATVVGSGTGVGFNVNIPWNQKGMGNAEYVTAFLQVVLPIAYQFAPELVLVSAGFDAAAGDPLGGCKVTPETYGLLMSWLTPLAMGRVIVCLEGGYNLSSISYAMTMCTKAILGDPVPPVCLNLPIKTCAAADLRTVLEVQRRHWPVLCFNKQLPKEDVLAVVPTKTAQDNINEELLSKLSLSDSNKDTIKNSDNVIDDLEAKFSPHMYIKNESSPQLEDSVPVEELSRPNMNQGNLVKQVPIDNNEEKSGSRREDNAQPGSSQGSSASSGAKSVKTTLDVILKGLGMDEGFAVYPRHDCPHVVGAVMPIPTQGIDVSTPCSDCLPDDCASLENWICLTCYSVRCGRVIREHMMFHYMEMSHPIVLGYQDLSVWCYMCDSYIENPVLYEAKNAAYISKFGHAMPDIYPK